MPGGITFQLRKGHLSQNSFVKFGWPDNPRIEQVMTTGTFLSADPEGDRLGCY